MADARKRERAERQERVAKVVWGLLLITMGVIFSLDNAGGIEVVRSTQYTAGNAVDGNLNTRWSSAFKSPQWIEVDLGATAALAKVKLNWESAHARDYQIQVSEDHSSWTTVVSADDRHGGIEEHEIAARGRYVRMNGLKRSSAYGYSLWEFEVYGTDAEGAVRLLSHGKPASASSVEEANYWTANWPRYWPRFWPLFLLALGLPALLAPKSDGDQLWGAFLTAAGVLAQLHALQLITWGLSEGLPVLLMLGGVILVVQSLRRARAGSGDPDGNDSRGAR